MGECLSSSLLCLSRSCCCFHSGPKEKASHFSCLSSVVFSLKLWWGLTKRSHMKSRREQLDFMQQRVKEQAESFYNSSVQLHCIVSLYGKMSTLKCDLLLRHVCDFSFSNLLSFIFNFLTFLHSILSPFSLWSSSPLSIWRPLRGGRTWWWSMLRHSFVFTQLTWTQPWKCSHPTAGTVSHSSSFSTTSWGWTVSENLSKSKYIIPDKIQWQEKVCDSLGISFFFWINLLCFYVLRLRQLPLLVFVENTHWISWWRLK